MAGIDSNAFKSNTSILKIKFGSQCKFVGDSAFQGCTSLYEINENNVITNIGESAFESTGLKSVTFKDLNLLSDSAFMNCSELKTVNMPLLTDIPSQSFQECSLLENIDMQNVKNIGEYAFEGCTKLKDFNFKNCTSIGGNAFYNCECLEKINLYICESIGVNAFNKCSKLKEVYINNPKNIKCELNNKNAFTSTHKDITFYFRPETLGSYYFDDIWDEFNDKMKYIQQNNQIIYKTSNQSTISGNTNYPDNQYNNNVLNYGWITFNNKVEILDLNIFNIYEESRSKITYIQIPPECVSIGDNLFKDCTQLKEIKLSDTLTHIGEYSFKNCESFISFEIPESVNSLGEGAFAGCKGITKFSGNKQFITNGDFVVFNNTLICVLPKKVTNIYQISSTKIIRLGKSCFHGCENMKVVDIPSNIKEIGDNAFDGCKNLCEVHFNGDDPPELGINVFKDCLPSDSNPKDFKIFVPGNSFDIYKNQYTYLIDYIYPIEKGYEVFVVSDYGTIEVKVGDSDSEENGINEIMGVILKRENF